MALLQASDISFGYDKTEDLIRKNLAGHKTKQAGGRRRMLDGLDEANREGT